MRPAIACVKRPVLAPNGAGIGSFWGRIEVPDGIADESSRVSLSQQNPNPHNRGPQIALPPLILHPFGTEKGTEQLMEGSRAAMALQQASESNPQYSDIQQRVILGRYQEIRMLL